MNAAQQLFRISADWFGGGFSCTLPFPTREEAVAWAQNKARAHPSAIIEALPREEWLAQCRARQGGTATLQTLLAVAIFILVLGWLGPALDGQSYGAPTAPAPDAPRTVEILADKHCQSRGGENAAWVRVGRDGAFVCTDKRGRRHGSVITILHRAEP